MAPSSLFLVSFDFGYCADEHYHVCSKIVPILQLRQGGSRRYYRIVGDHNATLLYQLNGILTLRQIRSGYNLGISTGAESYRPEWPALEINRASMYIRDLRGVVDSDSP